MAEVATTFEQKRGRPDEKTDPGNMYVSAPAIPDQVIEFAWRIRLPLCLEALRHHADAYRREARAELVYPLRTCIGHRSLLSVKSLLT